MKHTPPGQVIIDNQYYTFSSILFYAPIERVILLNGRVNNLEYGSNEPGAPAVFIRDADLPVLWHSPERQYLLVENPSVPRLQPLLGADLHLVRSIGGKSLYTNRPLN